MIVVDPAEQEETTNTTAVIRSSHDAESTHPRSEEEEGEASLSSSGNGSFAINGPTQQQQVQKSPSKDEQRDASSSVQVAVRVRPLLALEHGTDNCVEVFASTPHGPKETIRIGGSSGPRFTFDQVFDVDAVQADMFEHRVVPLVNSCLEGYNATILAYGQTGSGKTYTMMGPHTASAVQDVDVAGVVPRAVHAIFESLMQEYGDNASEYQVRVQFLELYGEDIRDLLSPSGNGVSNHCTIRDIGVDEPEVVGATQREVSSAEEALLCLTHGMLRRVTGSTAMNESSSRSHAILSVLIEQSVVMENVAKSSAEGVEEEQDPEQQQHVQVKRSKFSFVDLAGSERQKRTQAEGKRLREGIDINKGLLVLGNVISALGDPKKRGKTFVPYRDSKLTRLLKGSLGGNHKTLMIACVSPSSNNMDESLNCLRYANRAKNIQNNAVVNLDASSRMIAELQGHVSTLAYELMRAYDGESVAESRPFTRDVLESMASGARVNSTGGAPTGASGNHIAMYGTPQRRAGPSSPGKELRETQVELSRAREQLRRTQSNHDAAEEQLYAVKAEKELFELQLSVLSNDGGNGARAPDAKDEAFFKKAEQYEREIGALRAALRESEEKAHQMVWDDKFDNKGAITIEQANKDLEADRQRLAALKATLSPPRGGGDETTVPDGVILSPTTSEVARLDAEESADQAELDALTNKYLAKSDHVSDAEMDSDDESEEDGDGTSYTTDQRQQDLQASLVELSRNIHAKEDLIEQLKLSQQKYSTMRHFYEDKLKQMEVTLLEKEAEREQLVKELQQAKCERSSSDIKGRLREKEQHIATLRKKQNELRRLTTVSSRNDAQIARLQTDVRKMKQTKVDLQKKLGEERKSHMKEVKRLKKTAMQMDRELTKWKKVSQKREMEAKKANLVAKTRLQELGQLRSKYRDAEKRLRMSSLKRGVMAKAGLDSVIVGRRDSRHPFSNAGKSPAAINADAIRDHFDQKVAGIVRKEALVDKLAHEWEEHFELTSKKSTSNESESSEGNEDSDALSVQIQFKEDRIRELARRLGKQQLQKADDTSSDTTFTLFDKQFQQLCAGASPDSSKGLAARVLFGMIVRERRRVAALARTASSLDERVQTAEKTAATSEAALRTYMSEHRQELATATQSQQEHILSLMEMVKEESKSEANSEISTPENVLDPTLLVLANERISVLERQLQEHQNESNTANSYRVQLDDLSTSLESKIVECTGLEEQLRELRLMLRRIRRVASTDESDEPCAQILGIVLEALHPDETPEPSRQRRRSSRHTPNRSNDRSRLGFSPRAKNHDDLTHTSDSADDVAEPDWASDIMADLALIAEGKVPPCLEGTEALLDVDSKLEKGYTEGSESMSEEPKIEKDVFDRLTNPRHFTGTASQKRTRTKIKDPRTKPKSPGSPRRLREASNRLETSSAEASKERNDGTSPSADIPGPPSSTDAASCKEHKSVFERLMSPSAFTGTQKEKFHKKQLDAERKKAPSDHHPADGKSRAEKEDPDDKILADVLDSTSDREPPENLCENEHRLGRSKHEKGNPSRKMRSGYTQQNVFERLQRTTTQSYAVKHNGTPPPDSPEGRRQSPTIIDIPPHSGYTSIDVFERLQKTTTEAYAKKTHRTKHDGRDDGG